MNGKVTPVIPAEIHGFAVTVGIGPYPPGQTASHRKAMYARLTPTSRLARERMGHIGRQEILGTAPLTPEGVSAITSDPQGRIAEHAATTALREAIRLARKITSPTGA